MELGNCANFVSQCLYSGGISQTDEWYSKAKNKIGVEANKITVDGKNAAKKLLKNLGVTDSSVAGYYEKRNSSAAWKSASEQFAYFSNPENGYISGKVLVIQNSYELNSCMSGLKNPIQEGDLIYWVHRENDEIYHASIISLISDNKIYCASNTNDRTGLSEDDNINNIINWGEDFIYIVRIRDDA